MAMAEGAPRSSVSDTRLVPRYTRTRLELSTARRSVSPEPVTSARHMREELMGRFATGSSQALSHVTPPLDLGASDAMPAETGGRLGVSAEGSPCFLPNISAGYGFCRRRRRRRCCCGGAVEEQRVARKMFQIYYQSSVEFPPRDACDM